MYIGIVGTKHQGKDTFAAYLQHHLKKQSPWNTYCLALADTLKTALAEAFWIDPEYFTDQNLKEQPLEILGGKSVRQALQTFGTEWAQAQFGKEVWCRVLETRLGKARKNMFAIVTDVRFEHELDYFNKRNAFMIYIYRDRILSRQITPGTHDRRANMDNQTDPSGEPVHISEAGLYHLYDAWDPRQFLVANTGSLDDLDRIAEQIATKIVEKVLLSSLQPHGF